ncbi:30S ribosomal protein S20 [Buchnera aphidicola (Periphyllus testudinaceus)]|uniref:30S ribosomal protein S20 n=1 Tax=Buchnera aphidicola TaxID=9 RepID=UPI003463CA47
MANLKASKKNVITSEKKKNSNNRKRSIIKTYIKKVLFFISSNDVDKSIFFFNKVQSIVDKYSLKGIIHKNKAARYKSNLFIKIRNMNNLKNSK